MKPHILLIGEAVTLTHVIRPKQSADALHAAGYRVTLACDPRFDALLGPRPYRTVPLRSAIDAATNAAMLKRNQPLFSPEILARYAREDMRLMRLLQPNLVVGDMRQSLSISARLLKVPYVNVINAHWSPYSDEPFGIVNNPWRDLVGRDMADQLVDLLAPVGSMLIGLPLNVARINHGLPPVGLTLKDAYADGDFVVYPDIPDLNPTRDLPAHHRYIGPIQWTPEIAPPAWWNEVPADKAVVYVNLGSSGESGLLQAIVEGLADLPVTVLVGTTDRGSIAGAPPNVFAADFIAGDAAARRAAVVICNGGASTGYQALAAGTPFLGIPSNTDQLVFTRLVSRRKAGACLLEGDLNPASLRLAVTRMLDDPAQKASAMRLAGILAGYDAAARLVSFIDEVLDPAASVSRVAAARPGQPAPRSPAPQARFAM